MKVEIPVLDLRADPDTIRANRALIVEAMNATLAAQQALRGLQAANQALCTHPNRREVYDPGYAGAGFSHYACEQCGMGGG